jgi:hypothetical protein
MILLFVTAHQLRESIKMTPLSVYVQHNKHSIHKPKNVNAPLDKSRELTPKDASAQLDSRKTQTMVSNVSQSESYHLDLFITMEMDLKVYQLVMIRLEETLKLHF